MKQLTSKEFLAKFDDSVHDALMSTMNLYPDAESFVVFENHDMWSSQMGARTAMICGPSNTYKSWRDTEGKWLGDLPSQRQYAYEYCLISDLKGAT